MAQSAQQRAPRRTQAERRAATRRALVDAAIAALIEHGYAHATAVDICRRAGVTRGAFHHHFESPAALFIEVLEQLYAGLLASPEPGEGDESDTLEAQIRRGWERFSRPEYKAVIEIWLAARNDPELGRELAPAIARMSRLFDPERRGPLPPRQAALHHLAIEAMIGLALGRATSPGGAAVAHESKVIDLLISLVREPEPPTKGAASGPREKE